MLRPTFKFCVNLLLIAVIISPLPINAKKPAKEESIDLSILKQTDSLIPYMTASQKIDYIKLSTELTEAQSDLRSGEVLVKSKPSVMAPNQSIKPKIERGKKLIAQAEKQIYKTQAKLVELLHSVEQQQQQQLVVDQKKFNLSLESASVDEALQIYSQKLLEACWNLGYETLFFDGVFILNEEGSQRAEAEIRNKAYDALVKIDGTSFSVTIPVNFKLKPETNGKSTEIFTYENEKVFAEDKKALLAFEWISEKDSSTSLLSMRAIDLSSQLIITEELVKIINAQESVSSKTTSGANNSESIDAASDLIPNKIELSEHSGNLDKLAQISPAYTFDMSANAENRIAKAMLRYSLLKNSDLQIADSNFIYQAYGSSQALAGTWVGQANAHFSLEKSDDESYKLNAQADSSPRILSCGTLQLSN
jgi:hypothetical protein